MATQIDIPEDLHPADAPLKSNLFYTAAMLLGDEIFEVDPLLFSEFGEQLVESESVDEIRSLCWSVAQELKKVPGSYTAYHMASIYAGTNEKELRLL